MIFCFSVPATGVSCLCRRDEINCSREECIHILLFYLSVSYRSELKAAIAYKQEQNIAAIIGS